MTKGKILKNLLCSLTSHLNTVMGTIRIYIHLRKTNTIICVETPGSLECSDFEDMRKNILFNNTTIALIPASAIGLYYFRYISPLQDDGSFSDVTIYVK